MPGKYTIDDEVDCLRRELQRRRQRYPALVQAGKLSPERAEREIQLMQAVYDRLLALSGRREQPELFEGFSGGVRICGRHQQRAWHQSRR